MMEKLNQSLVSDFLFLTRRPELLLFTSLLSLLLLFSQCSDEKVDPDDPSGTNEELTKSVYQIKGLDDSFYKEYAAYTYFDIDTTSAGDTLSILHTSRLEDNDKLDLTIFIEEAFQLKMYEGNMASSKHDFLGDIMFDNIYSVIDSGYFEVKTFDGSSMGSSINIVISASGGKRYQIICDDIIATNKSYLIPE